MTSAGVLALQGGFEPHVEVMARLGVPVREVRRPADLQGLTHLILPGGESTTIRHLLDLFALTSEITRRGRERSLALFGTCAGAILLGADDGTRPRRLGLLDAGLSRNAYGRQVDSFTAEAPIELLGAPPFPCVFIRAPKFARVGPDVQVLAWHDATPIAVRSGRILAATFHPELSGDDRIHRMFVGM